MKLETTKARSAFRGKKRSQGDEPRAIHDEKEMTVTKIMTSMRTRVTVFSFVYTRATIGMYGGMICIYLFVYLCLCACVRVRTLRAWLYMSLVKLVV